MYILLDSCIHELSDCMSQQLPHIPLPLRRGIYHGGPPHSPLCPRVAFLLHSRGPWVFFGFQTVRSGIKPFRILSASLPSYGGRREGGFCFGHFFASALLLFSPSGRRGGVLFCVSSPSSSLLRLWRVLYLSS